MKFRKLTWVVLLVVLAMVLAACGGDDDNGDDNGGSGGDEVNLSQTVTASMEGVGEYTLHYPDGWIGKADGETIMVADSQSTLDKVDAAGSDSPSPESGEVAVTGMALPEMAFSFFGIEEGGSMADAINGFSTSITDEEDTSAEFGDAESFDASGKPGALLAGTVTEGDNSYGAILVAVEVEGGVGLIMVITHPDDVDGLKATARAMAGELEFTPAATE